MSYGQKKGLATFFPKNLIWMKNPASCLCAKISSMTGAKSRTEIYGWFFTFWRFFGHKIYRNIKLKFRKNMQLIIDGSYWINFVSLINIYTVKVRFAAGFGVVKKARYIRVSICQYYKNGITGFYCNWPENVRMSIFGVTFFGHNSAIFGLIGLTYFVGTQETIIY